MIRTTKKFICDSCKDEIMPESGRLLWKISLTQEKIESTTVEKPSKHSGIWTTPDGVKLMDWPQSRQFHICGSCLKTLGIFDE